MNFTELCQEAKVDEKTMSDLVYSQRDPMEMRDAIMQKYGIVIREIDMIDIMATMPMKTIKIYRQEE
jgi:hypothetical protein